MLLLSPLVIQAKSFPESFSTFQIDFPAERKMWLLLLEVAAGKCGVDHDVLKKCNKLNLSSRVKLPSVRMSASRFLDSTYFI